jgi:dihydrofolate reductase
VLLDYAAVWMATPRFVFSNTLESVEWNSRLVRGDVGAVLQGIRAEIDGDIELAGPTIAAQFVRRGLVDEYGVVVHPVILGGGTPFLPQLDAPIRLRLKETRSFKSGAVYMAYDVVRDGEPA